MGWVWGSAGAGVVFSVESVLAREGNILRPGSILAHCAGIGDGGSVDDADGWIRHTRGTEEPRHYGRWVYSDEELTESESIQQQGATVNEDTVESSPCRDETVLGLVIYCATGFSHVPYDFFIAKTSRFVAILPPCLAS